MPDLVRQVSSPAPFRQLRYRQAYLCLLLTGKQGGKVIAGFRGQVPDKSRLLLLINRVLKVKSGLEKQLTMVQEHVAVRRGIL